MSSISQSNALLALSKAKIQLMLYPDSVFYTTLAYSLKQSFDDSIPTAATNGTVIKYNTKFFMDLNPDERIFLMLHEAMHCAYLHIIRGLNCDKHLFNIACDHVINLQLIERGFKMPKGGYADAAYTDMSAEEIYKILIQLPKPPPQDMDGDLQECDAPAELVEREMQDIVMRAALKSQMANEKPGAIPGEIQIFLNKLLAPKLPWHRILQKYLLTFAKNNYTFRKPNKRHFPKYHLPSLYSEQLIDIAIAVDISGSVTDADFLRFITETQSIMKMMKPEKITLIQFDTEIQSVTQIRNVRELMAVNFIGRGGTSITPVLEWADINKPQLLLVFTDGYFRFYDQVTKVKTLWLINDNKTFTAPFGKVIHYSMEK
jgi:predicted metal-dependent peptidase